ncbi:beta-ketoacyl synthase N-terminal-like domain-containing protein [Nocardia sp. PE-7]|uniref:type I polyketide synthase n=1 Tax=Nocardia sp. PE-7 TaxID=3058426 RepID=UPI00265A8C95|nr:type I polyketide synthase [Nocardia sp. PE-7]WKG11792.1 beta-ketoacyl synthase N-terminal-like domain-containing protein [Nocardia sp. PE-7]
MSGANGFLPATLVDILVHRSRLTPDRPAMRFVRPTKANRFETDELTYADIDARARSVAVRLASECAVGERILLLCPPGLEYTMYFYGCLYAGLIPVPAYPPASNRHLSRVETIARSARATAVLTAQGGDRHDLGALGGDSIPTLRNARWFEASRETFSTPGDSWVRPEIDGETTALLQYTSGSTSAPKGVIVSHANLLNNARMAQESFCLDENSVGAGWLPPYHDMGLLGGLVSPVYTGFPVVVISPMTFVRDPLYWLEVISREGATSSAGPNFAYQLCVDKADPERIAAMDLSRWKYALNGSEPVRAEVLSAFAEKFAPAGFSSSSFYPCYGLAEATLLVTGARPGSGEPIVTSVSTERLAVGKFEPEVGDRSALLVSSGRVTIDTEVRIVDPATGSVLPDGTVGAVWIRGMSVASGYFENEAATEATFGRYTDTGEGPYLDPGDLGCLVDGELFVTGRSKEVMNFRGRNVYPQDVESTAVYSHPGLDGTRCVAFSIEVDGTDQLVVLQQKPRRARREFTDDDLLAAIRRAVSEQHQLAPYDVLLVPARAIPVTSSGKLQRAESRLLYLAGEFGGRGVEQVVEPVAQAAPVPDVPRRGRRELEDLMVELVSRHAGLTVAEIDPREQFASFGLDSMQAVRIAGDLSEALGIEIPPTLAWEYPSIAEAAAALVDVTGDDANDTTAAVAQLDPGEPIAVVGIGCRLPGGVDGPEGLWDLLLGGRSGVDLVPSDRWDVEALFDADPDAPGRTYSRHGGFLSDVRGFDAGLFGVSAHEATSMDPQHRLVLETAWEAIEHAGIAPDALRGSATGVFIGMAGGGDYERLGASVRGIEAIDAYVATGNASNFGANRLSYLLGLQGPSLVVDTACSSSLVSVHLAAQSLRSRECDTALAGGVNLLLSPEVTVALSKGRMLSATGQCRTFDAGADGYVRGEGAGVVVLRRLSDAVAAGDRIMCVIRGSAVNQDGRSSGLTAPSMVAQQLVVQKALAAAGVAPAEVGYVEAHGTGTPLGDPIEVRALGAVLGAGREPERPVRLGSVKTNIGHLEAAAGIAGFIKAALVVSHGIIPPHRNLTEPNPHIAWDQLPVLVPRRVTEWGPGPRVAGVSSFGFGGTNAHIVLGAAPEPVTTGTRSPSTGTVVVKVSAADQAGLAAAAGQLAELAAADPTLRPHEIAWAAGVGRADLSVRAAVVAESRTELIDALREVAAAADTRPRRVGAPPRVAFLAPGHGARIAGALAGIYGMVPEVTAVLDEIGAVDELPLSVLVRTDAAAEDDLLDTEVAQPALYALGVALGSWWRSVGVEPDLVTGHSVGAYAAAALAGVFSIAEGARLVAARGQAMSELAPGSAMASLAMSAADAAELLALHEGSATIAVVNSATDVVIAGPAAEIDTLVAEVGALGVRARKLPVSQAFHSAAVEPMLPRLRAAWEAATRTAPDLDFVSDSSGMVLGAELTEPGYWVEHTREPVRFDAALRTVIDRGVRLVVELGPGALLPLVSRADTAGEVLCLASAGGDNPLRTLNEALARVWSAGRSVRWRAVAPRPDRVPDLPTYPFQRVPYWITDDLSTPGAGETMLTASTRPRSVDEQIEALQRELARMLGLAANERIDPDAGLFELGLTSAMAVELLTRLRETHTVPLPPTVVFEHPTVAKLAAYLARQEKGPVGRSRRARVGNAEPIAIVGMACRFPGGANDLDSYWDLLRTGRDGTGPVPADRAALRIESLGGFRGGFLDGAVAGFDAAAFGISPREARSMDPQQRLLLEVTWEALDDAGIAREQLDGVAGSVHIGMNTTDYLQLLAADGSRTLDPYFATGNTFSVAAGRISYLLGLRGASLAVDTACSSSLVATDQAVRELRSGTSDIALVGGVNLMLSPATVLSLQSMGALAADGRCKTFDASADGYGRGEGCGVLVLKRLSDARRDGDRIWALVRGSAVNQDGRSAGLTVPSGTAQAEVVADALGAAGVRPESVGYVEAHGTGTPLGDPIEVSALLSVLRPGTSAAPLLVGSAKTNIGHLEAAAGVGGLIKTALALKHGVIPPHLHCENPNPGIAWDGSALVVPTEPTDWPDHGAGRIGGVSSFGFSGTNAHVILQEPPATEVETVRDESGPELIVLSTASPDALSGNASALADALATGDVSLRDVAGTVARHRSAAPYRRSVVASTVGDAVTALRELAEQVGAPDRAITRGRGGLLFVFSGQGSQWAGLGRALLAEPSLRAELAACDAVVQDVAGWSLITELERPEQDSRLTDTRIAQPLLCAVQIALTSGLAEWGVRPGGVLGHSVGEIAAAWAAGTLTRTVAMRLAVRRGELMSELRGRGAMAVIGLPADRVEVLLEQYRRTHGDGDGLCVAAVNGVAATVIAGAPGAVATVSEIAVGQGARTQELNADYAFHSAQMAPAHEGLLSHLAEVELTRPSVPFYSTVTGRRAEDELTGADYWADATTGPVLFAAAFGAALEAGAQCVVEIGPDRSLAGAVRQSQAEVEIDYLAAMIKHVPVAETLRSVVGGLFDLGFPVALDALYPRGSYRRVELPVYRWQRQEYWLPGVPATTVDVASDLPEDTGDRYEIFWQEDQLAQAAVSGAWVLVADHTELAEPLARQLTAAGATAILVDGDFARTAGDAHWADVLGPVTCPVGVVHLVDAPAAAETGHDQVISAVERGIGTLLGIVQSWIRTGRAGRIFTVTRGATQAGTHRIALAQTPLWGLGRVIGLEQPALWGGAVDLDPADTDVERDAARLVARLAAGGDEDQIAFREDRVLVPRLRAAAPLPEGPLPVLDPQASYLVTGGRGSLGLRLADWLARRGARHLILLGRSPVVEAGTDVVEAIAALRSSGVTVYTPDADVAAPGQMSALFDADPVWPPVRGVVHAAGTLDAATVADMSMSQFLRVLRAKVHGGLVLDALESLRGVDFFLLFSSAAAVWGSALAGHYGAANHFLDMLAWDRRARGVPALAVDWGWWSDSTMAHGHSDYFASIGLTELTTGTALGVLDRTLAGGYTQLVVAPVEWPRFLPVMQAKRRRPLLALMAAQGVGAPDLAAAEPFLARLRALPVAGRERAVQDAVQREVAAVLGRPSGSRLDPRQGFFESGMDSITSVELKIRLEKLVGHTIPVTTAFEHPSVADLSAHLLDLLGLEAAPTAPTATPDLEQELLDLTETELLELLGQELDNRRIDDQH